LFPDFFDFVTNPEKWTPPGMPTWPITHHKLENIAFGFDVVVAPLPFTAACIRTQCAVCKRSVRQFVINACFHILCNHLAGASLGTRSEHAPLIHDFVRALWNDPDVALGEFVPMSLPLDAISSGIAWMVCHEVGHAVGAAPLRQLPPSIPESIRELFLSELNADRTAFNVLVHRLIAHAPTNDVGATMLAGGIELVLRTLAVVAAGESLSEPELEKAGSFDASGVPPVGMRWEYIRSHFEGYLALGIFSGDRWQKFRSIVFDNWNTSLLAKGSTQ
jgi:hypothetical protein